MLSEHHISVRRTARYFTLGEIDKDTRDIWIVIHGHRQLAGNFIRTFEELTNRGSFVIAPEGLMRLYVKGDYGEVGASWMTKEDRDSDINDYVNYLDKLFLDEIDPIAETHSLKINALGFSQGAATLSRWLALGNAKVDKAVFWCGSVAHDLDYSVYPKFKTTKIFQIFGKSDPYYKDDFVSKQVELLSSAGILTNPRTFEGGHEINFGLMEKAGIL